MESNQTESKWVPVLEWVLLFAITAVAIFLRYWRIEEVPPGFNSDEAVGAIGALTTLREGLQYSYEGQGGGGALGFYLAAITFYLFGPSIAAIRGLAAGAGVFSIFVNYWAIREVFRLGGLNRARWIAGISTLGLTFSIWHISASRVAFAGIGVPLFLMPSVYFLWLGLNKNTGEEPGKEAARWPFAASGLFLGFLMYIYLSGVFVPPLYAAFFIAQWLMVLLVKKFKGNPLPQKAYLTSQFWNLFITGLVATLLLLPMIYVLLFRPEMEPGTARAGQAFFLNSQINGGDPWGLLWRAIVGNFSAYGISLSWLVGRPPNLTMLPVQTGLLIFLGFLVSLWYTIKGRAAHLFIVLWYCILLLPSILSPDAIPHNLRTIGATTPTFTFIAIFIVWLFDTLLAAGKGWLKPHMNSTVYKWTIRGAGVIIAIVLISTFWNPTKSLLYRYFYVFPNTNDAQAAYHVYAVEMANEINADERPHVAFVLPRNTAAGDVFRNFTTDFLVELEQPPNSHYWIIDDERTLPDDLTAAAAEHRTIRVVEWLTSKHTGADPKGVIFYYLEKYGYWDHTIGYEYFKTHDYELKVESPDFNAAETLQPADINFGDQLTLTGFALGDAGDEAAITQPQARGNDILWLRLSWQKTGEQVEDLKASAQIFNQHGQLVTQIDKDLINNILQVGSSQWDIGATEDSYFLIPIPPATPPGTYTVQLAVYGEDSLNRLPVLGDTPNPDQSALLQGITITPAVKRAKPEHVNVVLPLDQEILPDFTLLGLETLPDQTVRTGQQVNATVLWLAGENAPESELEMTFVAQSPEGGEEHALSEPVTIAAPNYPPAQWQSGEVLRGWLNARVPLSLEPGPYKLSLRVSKAGNPSNVVATVPIGNFTVTGWTRIFDTPQPAVEIGANYNDLAMLAGLDANTSTLSPGDTLNTQLYWQSTTEFTNDYTAFVQLIGPDGLLYGQVDQTPGAGKYPTTGWLPGEYITDAYAVPLAPNAPPGDYQIAIGFYNPNTGERLPVTGPGCQPDVCLQPGLTVK